MDEPSIRSWAQRSTPQRSHRQSQQAARIRLEDRGPRKREETHRPAMRPAPDPHESNAALRERGRPPQQDAAPALTSDRSDTRPDRAAARRRRLANQAHHAADDVRSNARGGSFLKPTGPNHHQRVDGRSRRRNAMPTHPSRAPHKRRGATNKQIVGRRRACWRCVTKNVRVRPSRVGMILARGLGAVKSQLRGLCN